MTHFPDLIDFNERQGYTEEFPRSYSFVPRIGHPTAVSYRQSLDRLIADDVVFCPYDAHRGTRPFEEVAWFSGWIRASHEKVYRYLPERVKRQFGYVQDIPRHPESAAPSNPTLNVVDGRFLNYEQFVISEEDRGDFVRDPWDTVSGYYSWYYPRSHPFMRRPKRRGAPNPANLEILAEEEARGDDWYQVIRRIREMTGNREDWVRCPNMRLAHEQATRGLQYRSRRQWFRHTQ